ncbi:uncharacterized protein LOC142568636 [Dermacentor variabilis]|uniref:uncharacterized protein LOC142568636 n=1 Tax=Dermacentor variabilis TaxID=34621 RepID=UPI003F5C729F
MVNCVVFGCKNHTKKRRGDENVAQVGFFSLPKVVKNQCKKTEETTARRRTEWLRRINRKDLDDSANHYRVCGKHFISGRPAYAMAEADPDWAPSLHLGHGKSVDSEGLASRYRRKQRRSERRASPLKECQVSPNTTVEDGIVITEDALSSADGQEPEQPQVPVEVCKNRGKADFSHVTELTMAHIRQLEEENRHLLSELRDAKQELRMHLLSEDILKTREDMVQFYTGLPNFALLLVLFNLLKEGTTHTSRNSLTAFQEMLLIGVLVICRFHVSQSTVSRIVNKWLDVAYVRLSRAVQWPDRETLRATMPMTFRKSFGVELAVVIDCFEVFIERPSSMLARSHTWSNYKSHNTVKYLMGIAPQGVVTFVSKGWCGRTSDKVIAEKCGILNNLLPRDVVLADRGFTIADSVAMHCAKLAMPAFTKGKQQLSPMDVEKTRKIANVRIHVERVIGLVRNKYRILKHTLPAEVLTGEENGPTVLDKMVFVCAALCNMNSSTVPFG